MSTSAPVVRTLTVKFRIDDYPEQTASVKYQVFDEETEITLPKGSPLRFKNWDVRSSRERYFKEELAGDHNPEEHARNPRVELVEHGVRPGDVERFVGRLAQNPRYEEFFDLRFEEPAAPAPAPAKAKRPSRKFPYEECARLYLAGKTNLEIATALNWLDEGRPDRDTTHSVRDFLRKMHNPGYLDGSKQRIKLPYREEVRKAAAGGAA
jgi:hypothetical protein